MAQAYTPGLQVNERMRYCTRRLLPISGNVLKQVGDLVQAEDIVARSEQPGDVTPVNVANLLGVSPGEVRKLFSKKEGESVPQEDLLARSNGIFGFFKNSCYAPVCGTIESISDVTGTVIIRSAPVPVDVRAFASGVVTEVLPGEGVVIESLATFIQGIFGIGGEAYGTLKVISDAHQPARHQKNIISPDMLDDSHWGCIVVGSGRILGETVRKAVELGVSAVIGGGIDDDDLRAILGYDLGVAITGTESLGTTVIITEGFGDIVMADRTLALLKSREGSRAAVNGATQIRAGVMRPEIVIPWPNQMNLCEGLSASVGAGQLMIGSTVRIIRDPLFGVLGEVTALPHEPQVLATGSKARVVEVACRDGKRVSVPRANVEIMGA